MQTAATTTETPEGFAPEVWAQFKAFQAAEKAQQNAAERDSRRLTAEATLRRNETGAPFPFTSGCTAGDELLPKGIRCDGSDPGCRNRRSKPLAAPGEVFLVPSGHRRIINPALPEVDPAVTDEPTAQDRLLLGELHAGKQAAEAPASQADRTLKDLKAQRQILDDRILQQQAELDRRQGHVEAAAAKIQEFLSSRSEAWRTTILGGAAEASLESIRQAADEAERRRPECHIVDDIRRAQAGDVGPPAFTMGSGQPVKLKVDRSL